MKTKVSKIKQIISIFFSDTDVIHFVCKYKDLPKKKNNIFSTSTKLLAKLRNNVANLIIIIKDQLVPNGIDEIWTKMLVYASILKMHKIFIGRYLETAPIGFRLMPVFQFKGTRYIRILQGLWSFFVVKQCFRGKKIKILFSQYTQVYKFQCNVITICIFIYLNFVSESEINEIL